MSHDKKASNVDIEQSTDPKASDSQHMDKAAKFLNETQEYPPLTAEAEKKLLRKVDWIMIPVVSLIMLFFTKQLLNMPSCL
jgi:ACS family allantoate permease-like MFS transporter